MFDGIEMNVFDVPREVLIVADGVLPEPPLPQCVFPIWMAFDGNAFGNELPGKATFDLTPTAGEIRVVRRQGEERMQVIGQDYNRVDIERIFSSRRAKRCAKRRDMIDKDR